VISYQFGPDDLARVRFAISPLFELAASRQVVRDPARHSIHVPWAREAAARLEGLDLALLDAAISEGPYLPDFVTPPPERARPTLAGELRRVRLLSHDRIARELGWAYPGRRPPPAARILLSDPDAGLRLLTAQMAAYWERAVAPWWDRLRAALEADIAYRGARLAEGGPVAAFGDLHQDVVWDDGVVEVRRPYEATVPLGGRGLLLLPAVFAWPRVWAMTDPPWQPTLVYPPRGVGLLWDRPGEAGDSLADLLGRRRAQLLSELAAPSTTQELARRLGASAAGVSEHLGVLRRAGLVEGRREGRAVRYARTRMGDDLVCGPA
jgi:DNA-binding transcriptional ArsR family regulator